MFGANILGTMVLSAILALVIAELELSMWWELIPLAFVVLTMINVVRYDNSVLRK